MTNTVTEHLNNCKDITKTIADANALVVKLQAEFEVARRVFEALKPMQHPALRMSISYSPFDKLANNAPEKFIDEEISRINQLLGDRA